MCLERRSSCHRVYGRRRQGTAAEHNAAACVRVPVLHVPEDVMKANVTIAVSVTESCEGGREAAVCSAWISGPLSRSVPGA